MRIINKTAWRTADLRAIFEAGLKHKGATVRLVTVVYSRGAHVSGVAWHYDATVKMRVPPSDAAKEYPLVRMFSDGAQKRRTLVEEIAAVWEHELQHILGTIKHRDFQRDLFDCSQPVPWVMGCILHLKDVPVPAGEMRQS